MNLIALGFLVSLSAGLLTGLGAVPLFFSKNTSERILDGMLGFAAGVMLSVTTFGLLMPAVETGGVWVTIAGFAIGAIFLALLDRVAPHMHLISGAKGLSTPLGGAWLIMLAVAIHNFPEGLAVGIGFGTGDIGSAMALAIAIGLHNIPEGLAVALPLVNEGCTPKRALWYTVLTGLVQPIGGLIGVSSVIIASPILPYGLAFAAGAMLYVVFDELMPQSYRRGHQKEATFGALAGFALMMILEKILG